MHGFARPVRGDDRDDRGHQHQQRRRAGEETEQRAPRIAPHPALVEPALPPERDDTETDQHGTGYTAEHRRDVVAGEAIDGDVAEPVRDARGQREQAAGDRREAAEHWTQRRVCPSEGGGDRHGDEAAGQMVRGCGALLGMQERVVDDGQRGEGERNPEHHQTTTCSSSSG